MPRNIVIPARFAPLLFALLLSCVMSLIVAGIATLRAIGWTPDFAALWARAWLSAWLVAFPAVLVIAPFTRRVVARLVGQAAAR
jgi:hypothetical protein